MGVAPLRAWRFIVVALAATLASAQVPLTISPTLLPLAGQGQGYNTFFFATGSNQTVTYSIASGSLPPGLNLSNNGVISGSPTAAGVYAFRLRASSPQPAVGTVDLSITVVGFTTGENLGSGDAGALFTRSLALNIPSSGVNWSVVGGNLPPGLTLTGVGGIVGVPIAPGSYSFTVEATVPNGFDPAVTVTRTFSITVTGIAPLSFATTALPLAAVNVPMSFQLLATGGTGTYTWKQVVAPAGLSVSASGLLSGTPTQVGILPLVVRVDSGTQTTGDQLIYMGIIDILNDSPLPEAEVAVPYLVPIQLSFGIPTWSLVSGAPPPGLTFDTTSGVLSGTPTATGNYSITVQATVTNEAATTMVRKRLDIKVKPTTPVEITAIVLPFGGVGQDYFTKLAATGGSGSYTWSATALPPGLFLTSGGILLGTPTAPGVFSANIKATSVGLTGFASLPLIVVQIETPSVLPQIHSGGPYSAQLALTAGSANWTLISGRFPSGLTLAPQGFLSGTSTEAGQFQFRLRAEVANVSFISPNIILEKDFTVSVGGPPLNLTTLSLAVGQINALYGQRLEASGGDPPYRFSATGMPAGVSLDGDSFTGIPIEFGTFPVSITARDSASGLASRVLMLEITPTGPLGALLRISKRVLRLKVSEGVDMSLPQVLTAISSNSEPVSFTVAKIGAPWLTLETDSGQTPRTFAVRGSSAGLKPGEYTGSVRFSTDGQIPIEVVVILTVEAAAPLLEASPALLRFTSVAGTPVSLEKLLVVANQHGGGAIEYQAMPVGGSSWIGVAGLDTASAPNVPKVVNGVPSYLRVQVDTRGLAPGVYRDVIRLTSRASNVDVPVTLAVARAVAGLEVSERGVRLAARQGDPAPSRAIWIRNPGGADTIMEWKAEIVRGSDAFALTPATGQAKPGEPSRLVIGSKPDTLGKVGTSSALIRISDTAGVAPPRYITAFAEVTRLLGTPAPDLAPAGLLFQAAAHGLRPPGQTVALRLNYADPVSYAASATVDDGDGWLTVTPTLGQISADAPVELRVAVAPGRLAPGMHTGSVHVSVGNELRTVRVSFAIGPEAAAAAAADSKATVVARVAGGCTPTHTAFAQTVLASNFSAVAGAPVALGASVIDNCGAVLTGASVEARFSNGDASVSFEPNGIQGEYTAVWQPGVADSQTIITIEASSPGLAPARLELTGAVLANPDPAPRLSPGGILNNLSGELGGALAPGTATQMFGENLAPYISRAAEAPLPMKALGIEVMIGESKGDMDAPLYYLSPSQLTVQMPTELTAAGTYSAVVAVRDGFTLPELIDVVPFRAAAATSGGALLAFHADGAAVGGAPTTSVFGSVGVSLAPGAARPARPGEEVSIFLVGMGSTTPAVASGKASPRVPLATVAQLATVQVDGAPAVVTFQGLTPGQVGLYQMNFRVPDSARPGDLEVKIWQSDVAAQSGTLAVERP